MRRSCTAMASASRSSEIGAERSRVDPDVILCPPSGGAEVGSLLPTPARLPAILADAAAAMLGCGAIATERLLHCGWHREIEREEAAALVVGAWISFPQASLTKALALRVAIVPVEAIGGVHRKWLRRAKGASGRTAE